MGRLPDPDKIAASPTNRQQVARRERVLMAAAELGERDGFDAVQMNEIAKRADAAIGTLYRYFPTKVKLFATVFHEEVGRFIDEWRPEAGRKPVEQVADQLIMMTRRLVERPQLAAAMVQCVTPHYLSSTAEEVAADQLPLSTHILSTMGIVEPNAEDIRRVKLLLYAWWGVFASVVDDKVSFVDGEGELRMASRMLLTSCSCWRTDQELMQGIVSVPFVE